MPIRVPVKKEDEKARPKDFKRMSKTLKRKRGDEELEQLDKAALEFVGLILYNIASKMKSGWDKRTK